MIILTKYVKQVANIFSFLYNIAINLTYLIVYINKKVSQAIAQLTTNFYYLFLLSIVNPHITFS